jgi:uncharacterized protein
MSSGVWARQHCLVVFLGLAFALSWWVWPLYALSLSPTPFFACGPLVAALVVIGITEGWSGYRMLGARMIHWKVGWQWWIVALGTPLAVLAVAAIANVAIWGAPIPVLADRAWPNLALVFAVRFVNPLDGPLGEEPGWRGYALPLLQAGRAPLGAALILACSWRCGTCRWSSPGNSRRSGSSVRLRSLWSTCGCSTTPAAAC